MTEKDNQNCNDETQDNEIHFHELPRPHFNHDGRNAYHSRRSSYEPWYDDKADYNTNAKSYYDYLARFNGYLFKLTDFVNRLSRRNITVEDSTSIDFTKKGDWIDNGDDCHTYNDVIKLTGVVIISKMIDSIDIGKLKNISVPNGSKIVSDGVWSPDYKNALNAIQHENELQDVEINNIKKDITNITNTLQKVIDNLYNSGAITTNNIFNFDFNPGRNIATGNINIYGEIADGSQAIITHKGQANGDVASGLKI